MYTFISKYWNVPFILCQHCPILGHYSQGLEHSSTILEHRYVPSSIAWHCVWSITFFHLKFKGRHKLIQSSLLYYHRAPDSETSLMPVSSVPHVSDCLELLNNNWASGSQHPGPPESDVFSDVVQKARSNDLLHTVRLSVRLDTPLHGNNARGAKYAV